MKSNIQQSKKPLLQKNEDIQTIPDELTEEFSMFEQTTQSFTEMFEINTKEKIEIKQCYYNQNEKVFQKQESIENCNVEGSLENLKIYIQKYKPRNIVIDSKLKPFIPDYIPAFNNIEDCIMIPRPDGKNDNYGIHDVREAPIRKEINTKKINFNETQKEIENKIKQGSKKENQKQSEEKLENLEDIFKIISLYQPKTTNIKPILKPFIPDYIPQVQNPDAMLKIPRPDGKEDYLGLTMLDERKVKGLYMQ